MTICHVVYECFPGSYRGGIQKMVFELALAQAQQGADVSIWTIGDAGSSRPAERLQIEYFAGNERRFSSEALKTALKKRARVFSAVHAHNTFLPLNRYAGSIAGDGANVFFSPHGALDPVLLRLDSVKGLKKAIYAHLVERRNYRFAKGLFALTAREAGQIKSLTGERTGVHVVPNGIGAPLLATSDTIDVFREKWALPKDIPTILYIGRITRKKRIEAILNAFALVETDPKPLLVLAGRLDEDFAYTAEVQDRATQLGIANQVRWIGHLDETGKASAFGVGTVFVHASESEGMAMAILEAMSYGMPTVATRGCYMHDAAEAGALVEVGPSALEVASALAILLRDSGTRMRIAKRAESFIRDGHDWSKIAERYIKLYKIGIAGK